MPVLIFVEHYISSPLVHHFTNASWHISRAIDWYVPLKQLPADKVVIMVKVQPLNCTNSFHRGKSETEAAAASGGTAAVSLCPAGLGRAPQAPQVCSCALPYRVVSEMHRGWHTGLLLSIQKCCARVWKKKKSRLVMKEQVQCKRAGYKDSNPKDCTTGNHFCCWIIATLYYIIMSFSLRTCLWAWVGLDLA